jgi:Periplasmic binding protein domain
MRRAHCCPPARQTGRHPGFGKVGVIVRDYAFRCHEDREIGFRAYLRTAFPEVVLADVARGEDSPEQTRRATLDLFAVHPEIAAVYNVADGNLGLASALEELGHANDVIVVTHEANRITIPLLKKGTMDLESIKNRVLKPYFGLGSGLNDPAFQGLATDFPIRRWTSTRIFMLSKIAGYTFTLRY